VLTATPGLGTGGAVHQRNRWMNEVAGDVARDPVVHGLAPQRDRNKRMLRDGARGEVLDHRMVPQRNQAGGIQSGAASARSAASAA
jgi:hypothetical protein